MFKLADGITELHEMVNNIEKEIERLKTTTIKPTEDVNEFLKNNNSSIITSGIKLIDLLKRKFQDKTFDSIFIGGGQMLLVAKV